MNDKKYFPILILKIFFICLLPFSLFASLEPVAPVHAEGIGAQAYFKKGLELEKQGRYSQAKREFILAYAEDLNLTRVYRELGNCAYGEKKSDAALQYYEEYLRYHPEDLAIQKFYRGVRAKRMEALNALFYAGSPAPRSEEVAVLPEAPGLRASADLWWQRNFEDACKNAASSGKVIFLAVQHNCSRPVPGENLNPRTDFAYSIRLVLGALKVEPRYLDWLSRNFVLVKTERNDQCWDLVTKLSKKGQNGPCDFSRDFILMKPDMSDWRSTFRTDSPEGTMLFCIEALREFRNMDAKPYEEITICKLPASGYHGIIESTSTKYTYVLRTRANLYIAERKGGPFQKLNDVPIETVGVKVTGLDVGREYFLAWAGVDAEGVEGPRVPWTGVWKAQRDHE